MDYILKPNDVVIKRISGLVNLYYLNYNNDDYPSVIIFEYDNSNVNSTCDKCEIDNGCYEIYDSYIYELLNNLVLDAKYPVQLIIDRTDNMYGKELDVIFTSKNPTLQKLKFEFTDDILHMPDKKNSLMFYLVNKSNSIELNKLLKRNGYKIKHEIGRQVNRCLEIKFLLNLTDIVNQKLLKLKAAPVRPKPVAAAAAVAVKPKPANFYKFSDKTPDGKRLINIIGTIYDQEGKTPSTDFFKIKDQDEDGKIKRLFIYNDAYEKYIQDKPSTGGGNGNMGMFRQDIKVNRDKPEPKTKSLGVPTDTNIDDVNKKKILLKSIKNIEEYIKKNKNITEVYYSADERMDIGLGIFAGLEVAKKCIKLVNEEFGKAIEKLVQEGFNIKIWKLSKDELEDKLEDKSGGFQYDDLIYFDNLVQFVY